MPQDILQSGSVECINFRLIHGICTVYTVYMTMWMWHRTKGCLSLAQPLWHQDAVCCQIIATLTVARSGWWTSNEVSGSSLPTPIFGCITCYICLLPGLITFCSSTCHKRQHRKLGLAFCHSCDDGSEPVFPLVLSTNKPPIQECKQTSQESTSTSERPRCNQAPVKCWLPWTMVDPKLKNTECSVVIHQACIEICSTSRCKRQNFN